MREEKITSDTLCPAFVTVVKMILIVLVISYNPQLLLLLLFYNTIKIINGIIDHVILLSACG